MGSKTFTKTDGVNMSYCLGGAGPPLYVCHGGPFACYESFLADLEPLARDFTLAFHDYRGSGDSGSDPPATYDFSSTSPVIWNNSDGMLVMTPSACWPIRWASGSRSPMS